MVEPAQAINMPEKSTKPGLSEPYLYAGKSQYDLTSPCQRSRVKDHEKKWIENQRFVPLLDDDLRNSLTEGEGG
jgi:hypothetical protein